MFGAIANLFQDTGSDSPKKARKIEQARQQTISNGVSNINRAFAGFDSEFYNRRAQDYINYALPQIGEQARTAQKGLVASMNNRGLLRSSVAGEKQAELDQQTANLQAGVVDSAQSAANKAKMSNEQQRMTLVEQLIASQNPQLAKEQTLIGASNIATPNNASNISSMMSQIMNAVLAQKMQEQTEYNNIWSNYTTPK